MKTLKRSNPVPAAGTAKPAKPVKHAKKGNHSRNVTLAALTLALGTAVYLNWSFAKDAPVMLNDDQGVVTDALLVSADQGVEPALPVDAQPDAVAVFDQLPGTEADAELNASKNYGEAQLVSVSKDSGKEFFEAARLARSRARDTALEEIENALKNSALTREEKDALSTQLATQLGNLTVESDLETLIKAKGFADCVVMLTGTAANVTVMTENDALTAAEVTQIRDAVLGRCPALSAQDITVVEVK